MELNIISDVTSHASAELYQSLSKLPNGGSIYNFPIKKIKFLDKEIQILMQMANGPCPLLSIANALILKGKLTLPNLGNFIEFPHLLDILLNFVIDMQKDLINNSRTSEETKHQVFEIAKLLPAMLNGLDINCGFQDPHSFQFSLGLFLFEICQIELVHGWILAPEDPLCAIIADLYYNDLLDKIVQFDSENVEELSSQHISEVIPTISQESVDEITTPNNSENQNVDGKNILSSDYNIIHPKKLNDEFEIDSIRNFLKETTSQLTYHGLLALHSTISESHVAVLFRNNHFSTLYMNDGQLFILVNDNSFLQYPNVVWEKLMSIDGDNIYCDYDFEPSKNDSNSPIYTPPHITDSVQENTQPQMMKKKEQGKKKKKCNIT